MRSSLAYGLVILALYTPACAGPPVPSSIEGEPSCPDFEVGAARTKMQGGLRFPLTLTVREDGEAVARATLLGRPGKESRTRVLLTDENADYTVEWAQCENQRAPRAAQGREGKEASEYECGKATVYKTDPLVTKKGDAASRILTAPPPPDATCWTGETPASSTSGADAGAAPPEVADAGQGAEPATAPDAGATAPDAGVTPAATDAGAGPADGGTKKKANKAAAATAAPTSPAPPKPATPAP